MDCRARASSRISSARAISLAGPITDIGADSITIAVPALGAVQVAGTTTLARGGDGAVALRPEKVRLHAPGSAPGNSNLFQGTRDGLAVPGRRDGVPRALRTGARELEALLANSGSGLAKFFEPGDTVDLSWAADAGHFIEG